METVKYDDGVVAARVNVAIDENNEVSTQFTEYKDEETAIKASLEDAAVLAESAGSENAAIIRSEAKATSKSVPDNTQSASIKDGVVTVTNKHGRTALGKYSFTLEEYEKAKRTSANPEWGISEFIKAKNREAFPDNYRDMENFSLINRIEDSQIYAIKDAIKKLGTESSVKAETQVGDKLSPTSSKREQAIAIYENAGIPKDIAEKNIERIKAIPEGGRRDILHPDNKNSRKVFELLTGMKLPKGVEATKTFVTENMQTIKSALQESDKEVKSPELNPPTNADRPGSVPDAGKQEPVASGGNGESADSGRTGGE